MFDVTSNPGGDGFVGKIQGFFAYLLSRLTGTVDSIPVSLEDKIILLDNDELLLVWENTLREKRLKKEEEAWKSFEKRYGRGAPEVTAAFIKWQEQLYAFIEQEKDRFLKERHGSKEALGALLRAGAKTIVVTKGAKPYTEKCFNLVGLSPYISDIYSPAPGRREKRFVDAVVDHGKNTPRKCSMDTIIVGHDLEKDMGWDLVPPKGLPNDGNAPIFILFGALKFDRDIEDPLDALLEITLLLAKRGKNDFLNGFKSIDKPQKAVTQNYSFKVSLYHNPKRGDKARIPVIHEIRKRR